MIALQEIGTEHPHYTFIETLLHTAFPENERRDDDRQRWNADNEEQSIVCWPLVHNNQWDYLLIGISIPFYI